MREIIALLFIGTLLLSCKKDKVPEPCINTELTGKRASVVGTWVWDTTWVNQTFASGNTYLLYYTPATEGFNYFCVITADGKYKGYRDSVLVHDFRLTEAFLDNNDDLYKVYRFSTLLNCGQEQLNMTVFSLDTTDIVFGLKEYPIYINDPSQQKYSSYNRFRRI